MVTTVNIPVEGYILLIECRAKLAIIKSYIRSGNACYEDEKFLKCVLGMEEGTDDGWKFGYRTVGIAECKDNKKDGIYVHTAAAE